MANIPVEKKPQAVVPWWVWALAAVVGAGLLFMIFRPHGDAPGGDATAASPTRGVAITSAGGCTHDETCTTKELCIDGTCKAIDANLAECSAASVGFATSSTDIDPAQKVAIDRVARCLRADRTMTLNVEGSADQRGAAKMNDELADKRAHTVARELAARGVSPAQMHVVSYGENRLLCADNDEACWAKNRRTELHPTK